MNLENLVASCTFEDLFSYVDDTDEVPDPAFDAFVAQNPKEALLSTSNRFAFQKPSNKWILPYSKLSGCDQPLVKAEAHWQLGFTYYEMSGRQPDPQALALLARSIQHFDKARVLRSPVICDIAWHWMAVVNQFTLQLTGLNSKDWRLNRPAIDNWPRRFDLYSFEECLSDTADLIEKEYFSGDDWDILIKLLEQGLQYESVQIILKEKLEPALVKCAERPNANLKAIRRCLELSDSVFLVQIRDVV